MADLTNTPSGPFQPFTVTAELSSGIALGGGWGLALDGLLAAEIWAERKARLHAAGEATDRLADTDHIEDIKLPLDTCRTPDGRWHWAATGAVPSAVTQGHERDIRYWTGRMDNRIYRQTTTTMPGTVPTHQGRWRNRIMPVIITVCSHVSWRGVGNTDQVRRLLEPIAAIGKKRSQGEGRVLTWHGMSNRNRPATHGRSDTCMPTVGSVDHHHRSASATVRSGTAGPESRAYVRRTCIHPGRSSCCSRRPPPHSADRRGTGGQAGRP